MSIGLGIQEILVMKMPSSAEIEPGSPFCSRNHCLIHCDLPFFFQKNTKQPTELHNRNITMGVTHGTFLYIKYGISCVTQISKNEVFCFIFFFYSAHDLTRLKIKFSIDLNSPGRIFKMFKLDFKI